MVDKDEVINLYKDGWGLQRIGEKFHVSRQRINQIVRSLYTGTNYKRKHHTKLPTESEIFVANKLREMGHTVEHQNTMDLFDLLINGKIRIEVKHGKTAAVKIVNKKSYLCYYASGINKNSFDYLVFVCGELENAICYIIPANDCPYNLSVPSNPLEETVRQRLNKENWSLIK